MQSMKSFELNTQLDIPDASLLEVLRTSHGIQVKIKLWDESYLCISCKNPHWVLDFNFGAVTKCTVHNLTDTTLPILQSLSQFRGSWEILPALAVVLTNDDEEIGLAIACHSINDVSVSYL